MKIIEITNGLLLTLTNEEADLMKGFRKLSSIESSELSERQQYIADALIKKELLITFTRDRKTYYAKSSC
jgi:hypothetical protein